MPEVLNRLPFRRRMPPQPDLDLMPFALGPVDAPRACLLIHGFSGSPPELRPLGEYLAKQGIRVEGIRLAGHGTDPEALTCLTWYDWLQSASEGLERVARGRSKENVIIVGFSMGSLLGMHLCLAHAEQIGGIVSISTPIFFRNSRIHLVPILKHMKHWHDVRKLGTHTDPEAHNRYRSYRRYPLFAVDQLLGLMRATRKILPEVTTPALIMYGLHDSIIHPKSGRFLYKRLGSPQKELVWWHNSGHGVPFDSEREQAWERILGFVRQDKADEQ
ncbi:MAG TPA: alpha/beta fold hydrolase [Chloroflexia bacterium]|nr:alpha/beta fold hydrolase [Chloroflexia bacterium]